MSYECLACGTKFHETDQTRSEQRDGQCPSCGYEDLKVIPERGEIILNLLHPKENPVGIAEL